MVSGLQHSVAPRTPVTIADVDIRSEPPDHQAEAHALAGLARQMSENPREMLQALPEAALDEARSDGPGTGSSFVMHLPVHTITDRPAPPEGLGPCPTTTRARVLLVEDNVDAAEGMTMLLEFLGHEVRNVHDGIAALGEAARTLPAVVLIDIGLPVLDGYEVAARMRSLPGMDRAVLVALTGYGTTEHIQRAVAAGFQHHLTKPIDLECIEALFAKIGPSSPAALVAARQGSASRALRSI